MEFIKRRKNRPGQHSNEVQAAQQQDPPSVSSTVTSLRADMVPSSDILPARKSFVQRDNLRVLMGILLGLVIVGMLIYTVAGPGRPILEQNLAILANLVVSPSITPTFAASSTPLPPTNSPKTSTSTQSPSSTPQPTKTAVVRDYISPTATVFTPTPTVVPCRESTSISLADVGKTVCVQGTVLNTITNPTGFMVVFSYGRGAFFWVSYDLVWSKAKKNTCYQITGKIEQIGNSPMLVFGYKNMPKACP